MNAVPVLIDGKPVLRSRATSKIPVHVLVCEITEPPYMSGKTVYVYISEGVIDYLNEFKNYEPPYIDAEEVE